MAGHFIDGRWISSAGEKFSSHNPATEELVWEGAAATHDEVSQAVEAAYHAFKEWSSLPLEKRISYLEIFSQNLQKKSKSLSEIISKETGKPLWESEHEVTAMIRKVAISVDAYRNRCPERKEAFGQTTLLTYHKPHGVAAVFGPFNFPGHLPSGHIIPALLAGNTVVFKPSELTPLTGEELIRCWDLPKGVLNLLQGGATTGHYLAVHPRLDGLYFTGSYATGMQLWEIFSKYPEKIIALEMGGNNPLVINDVGDMEAAALISIQSAFATAGQRCSCARRLILVESREMQEFLKVLCPMIETIKVGPYTDQPQPFMGPVVSKKSMESLLNAQALLGASGGHSLIEMRALNRNGFFVTPGLMDVTDVAPRPPDEELFGPLLQLIRVPTFEDAIEEANRTRFGLTAGLLSRSEEKFQQFFREVKAGVINWNTPLTGASSHAPFGGVKKSGNLRPSGYYAADYCAYPVASMKSPDINLPKDVPHGITLLAKS